MPGPAFATHSLIVGEDQVIKRFRSWDRGEHRREWRALTLLARYAPGLAPEPLSADLDSAPPHVRMSRVAGRPLSGQAVTPAHLDAVAAAVTRLHAAVPAGVLAGLVPQPWLAAGAVNRMRSLSAGRRPAADADELSRAAFDAAARWLAGAADPGPDPRSPVFGQGDGNLANYLWDGEQIRLVDFEDSGRSDLAFELAVFAEHVSVWHDAEIETGPLLARFELTAAEAARVLFFRRAAAFYWLLRLLDNRDDRRDTPRRQAGRLLALLDG